MDSTAARELATADAAEALGSGSLIAVFSSETDQFPDVLLRYGAGWTEMVPGWRGSESLGSDIVMTMGQRAVVLWDARADTRGALDAMEQSTLTEEDLDALSYGSLLRGVRPLANPHWPNVLRRVRGGFEGLNPDHDPSDLIPTGAAVRYYGHLARIWIAS